MPHGFRMTRHGVSQQSFSKMNIGPQQLNHEIKGCCWAFVAMELWLEAFSVNTPSLLFNYKRVPFLRGSVFVFHRFQFFFSIAPVLVDVDALRPFNSALFEHGGL